MKASLFVGRWQPFHEGHKTLIESVLRQGKPAIIAIRDTELSPQNPYTVNQRWAMIQEALKDRIGLVQVVVIPDIDEICYGRNVGYAVRKIELGTETESVSGTEMRKASPRVIWLTGNSGSGKTTLAYLLKDRLGNAVVLDGDEMRRSISLGAGFSKEDREAHNLRVARLANVLYRQRHNVIVSVIAPFEDARGKIDQICHPVWIYVKRDMPEDQNMPYEEPLAPAVTVDTDSYGILECVNQISDFLLLSQQKH